MSMLNRRRMKYEEHLEVIHMNYLPCSYYKQSMMIMNFLRGVFEYEPKQRL